MLTANQYTYINCIGGRSFIDHYIYKIIYKKVIILNSINDVNYILNSNVECKNGVNR